MRTRNRGAKMPEAYDHNLMDQFIEDLFFREWSKLVRYAKIQLRRYGPNVIDHNGRAEEIVQELFYTAYKKAAEVKACGSPEGWLYNALYYKVKETLRDDRKWGKCLMLLPSEEELVPPPEVDELEELIPNEDYLILRRIYVEGYTYSELCVELGCKKSCLAMRVHRTKKVFRKNFGNLFGNE